MTTRIPEVYWILASVLGAVSLASLIGHVLKLRRPADPTIENLNARIRSWWILILVSGGALLAGRIAVILLFVGISFLALREFQAPVRQADYAALYVCVFLALPVLYVLAGSGWQGKFSIWIPVFGLPALAMTGARIADNGPFLDRTAAMLCGLVVCVYGISCIPSLMALRIPGYERRTPILMVFLVLIAQVSDVLQYVWGKLLGRHQLAPTLSPSKTVEGLLGGVLSATLLGALLWPMTPFSIWQAGLMAFLIAILGFLGGLTLSAIKRGRGIKDWSRLIEGHGGILDRIDSLCFSAPVFFHLTRYFFGRT
jgi:phosphatidate cytidylyltransferase